MTTYIYNKTSGNILRSIRVKKEDVQSNCGADESYIVTDDSIANKRVYNGKLVDIPIAEIEANKTAANTMKIIFMRNKLLFSSDWTDTVSARGLLGEQLYSRWQTYRAALRSMPESCDVNNCVWPLSPRELIDVPPTEAEIIASITAAVQVRLDSEARTHNYDGILSLCSYATSLEPVFKAEGQAGVEWRDACWRVSYQVMSDVKAGIREVPTSEGLIAELPTMVWPA